MTRPAEGPRPASSAETRALLDLARQLIQQVAVLVRNSYLHDPSNEVFLEPMDRLQALVREATRMEGKVDLEVVGSEVFVNNIRIRVDLRSLHTYKYFINELLDRGLGGLRFDAIPEKSAIGAFLGVLAHSKKSAEDESTPVNRRLAEAAVQGILALPPRKQIQQPPTDRRQRAIESYQQALDFIRHCMTNLESPAQVNVREAKRMVHKLVDLSFEEGDGFSMLGLAAIKSHDEYTFNHMVNVCVLAIAFGQRLGLSRQQLAQLGLCALYHDLGKLNIPLDILAKHGPLTDDEWAVMGNHTLFGALELYPMIPGDRDMVLRVHSALQHHIGHDGKGYPKVRLRGSPNLYARIVAVVDTFDAMTTKRVYQRQFLPDESLAVLQKAAGAKYDPLLVKAFVSCMGIYPVGSTVLLSTGEVAVVCEPSQDPEGIHRPKVKIATDIQGQPLPTQIVDLSSAEHASTTILRCVDPELFDINAAHYAV